MKAPFLERGRLRCAHQPGEDAAADRGHHGSVARLLRRPSSNFAVRSALLALAVVVSLWMVAIDLFPCLTDLLNHEKLGFGLNDLFDLRLFVAGDDDEVVTLAHNRRISGRRDLDRVETGSAAAFAVEGQRA
jgi:hypothetical protein